MIKSSFVLCIEKVISDGTFAMENQSAVLHIDTHYVHRARKNAMNEIIIRFECECEMLSVSIWFIIVFVLYLNSRHSVTTIVDKKKVVFVRSFVALFDFSRVPLYY